MTPAGTSAPIVKDLVLVGGGHAHVAVLRRFGMKKLPGVRLTLICRDILTPYSGMLPGYVAGHYGYDDIHIDLGRLARFAGARLYHASVTDLDLAARRVICDSRPPVSWDVLSIDTGSAPRTHLVPGAAAHAVPVKPINRFLESWHSLRERAVAHHGPLRIAVVGAGAGGVEILLAIRHRLARLRADAALQDYPIEYHLFSASPEILPTHNDKVREAFKAALSSRKVVVHTGDAVAEVAQGALRTQSGRAFEMDEILWVTAAGAPRWPCEAGLDVVDGDFIAVRETLQSTSHDDVFAVGDVATMVDHPRPKAGVFAVRQGKPLAENLRRRLLGKRLRRYRPQEKMLALISTGDRYAVASRGDRSVQGSWVWIWKDWIDRRFMRRYADLPEMPPPEPPKLPAGLGGAQAAKEAAMRCGGCGAKIGAEVLAQALAGLEPAQRDDVLVGLAAPDDAAIVNVPPGMASVQSVDFFRAMIDDPWMFGRIAANHALGDLYAMGAQPQTALAIATVPFGPAEKVANDLAQMLAGANDVLRDAGCALVGGHTAEAAELALGFAVNGLADPNRALRKAGLRPGDALILTKPVGTGTLFAADAVHAAKGRWIDAALAHMTQPAAAAARCLREAGATACTDVTGFGLLGHLVEMLRASGADAEIVLDAVPVLDGAEETAKAGHLGSLAPQNAGVMDIVSMDRRLSRHPRLALLTDPQTAGGLLAGVPADAAEACVERLREAGYAQAAIVGRVLPRAGPGPAIALT